MSSINSKKKRKRNPSNAGRKPKPQTKFKFDLENLEDTERDLRNLCQDDGTKDIVFELLCQMWKEISDSHTQETQTLYDVKDEETQTDISPLETDQFYQQSAMMTYSTCFTIYSTIWRILTRLSSCFLSSQILKMKTKRFLWKVLEVSSTQRFWRLL